MLLEDKVIEIFCMSNVFHSFFDAMMEKTPLTQLVITEPTMRQ